MNPNSLHSGFYQSLRRIKFGIRSSASIYSVVMLFLLGVPQLLVGQNACNDQGSGDCYAEYKTTSALGAKCLFEEFQKQTPPRRRLYRRLTELLSYNYHDQVSTNGVLGPDGDHCWITSIEAYSHNDTSTNGVTHEETYDLLSCSGSNFWSGSQSWIFEQTDHRDHYCNNPDDGCDPSSILDTYTYARHVSSAQLVSGDWFWVGTDTDYTYEDWHDACQPNGEGSTGSTNAVSVPISMPLFQEALAYETPTVREYTNSPASSQASGTRTLTLGLEFTDEDLTGKICSLMPGFPADWYKPDPNYDYFWNRVTYSLIDAEHVNGKLQEMKYHFAVPNSKKDVTYRVDWDLVTWQVSAGIVTIEPMHTNVLGTGDPITPAYTGDLLAPLPFWDKTPYGGYVITWVANIHLSIENGSIASQPAAGPYAAFFGAQGCSSCGSSSPQGQSGSLSWEFSLGRAPTNASAGQLFISGDLPTLALATPERLRISPGPGVQAVYSGGMLRQVRAPQAFVDVITNSAFSYELQYYLPSQYSSSLNGAGLFDRIGSPSPFATWRIQNPDASTNSFNTLVVTDIRGTETRVFTHAYSSLSGSWTVTHPGGLREDVISTTTVPNEDGGYYRTVTTATRTPGRSDDLKTRLVYQKFGGTNAGFEALIEETLSPDNNPQTNSYQYYEYSEHGLVGGRPPLKLAVHPDGSWEYYTYDPKGRLATVYTPVADEPPPAPNTVVNANACKQVIYDYQSRDPGDDLSREPDSPRMVTEVYLGSMVSRRYLVVFPGERQEIINTDFTLNWDDPANLATTTRFYTSGQNINRVKDVKHPDGTMETYLYAPAADGTWTNTVCRGKSTNGTTVIDGTEEVSVVGPYGQIISRTVKDIVSTKLLSREVYGDFDTYARARQVTYLDGRTNLTQFDCCGLESQTDKDGVQTAYGYDAMKRRTSATRQGITTADTLDSVGRVVRTVRIGTDSSQIELGGFYYDLAGRLARETNSLGGVTYHTYSRDAITGGLVHSITKPDGGTTIESHYLDGSLKVTSGSAAFPIRYENGVDDGSGEYEDFERRYTLETKLKLDGSDSGEWTRSYLDHAGRVYKVLYSDSTPGDRTDNPRHLYYFNTLGQLAKEVDPDGQRTLYDYNGKGELTRTVVDVDQDGNIDPQENDRITATLSDVLTDYGSDVRRTRTYVYSVLGQVTSNLVSQTEVSTDGLKSWSVTPSGTSTSVTAYGSNGARYVTNTAPDGSYSLSIYSYGQLLSTVQKDAGGAILGSSIFTYDGHGRQSSVTDYRNGATSYGYHPQADLVVSVTTPSPGVGQPRLTTATDYNLSLNAWRNILPDGTTVTNRYDVNGLLTNTSGSRTYPVAYSYDYAGRLKTMTTWRDAANSGTAAITTWNYDTNRGWLASKQYADGNGPSYTYTAGGRLKTRVWSRGVTTTYTYGYSPGASGGDFGDLLSVSYSNDPQSTPAVSYGYDRLGRVSSVSRSGMSTGYTYNDASQLTFETYTGGSLAGLSVTNGYDSLLRRTRVAAVKTGAAVLNSAGYTYTGGYRMQSATDNTGATAYSATYGYPTGSALVTQVTLAAGGTQRMAVTNSFDYLNRALSIDSVPGADAAIRFAYKYNTAGQRVRNTLASGSYWRYDYDRLGQVRSGRQYWADGTPVAGQQFDYAFDDIGNRTASKVGGDADGLNLSVASYSVNNLNQYVSRSMTGVVEVVGLGYATNAVLVNGQSAYRKGEYFWKELLTNNAGAPLWVQVQTTATNQTTQTGFVYVPQNPQTFTNDLDGNLIRDGQWGYGWDAENRLVTVAASGTVGPQISLRFEYDAKGRRIRKQVWSNKTFTGTPTNDLVYLYDGWNLVAELNATNQNVVRSYLWGLDLSGSVQGAGGVGGLLKVGYVGTQATNAFVAFDGNGNVSALVNAADGKTVAQYEYAPFGEVIRSTGPMAKVNPFRFSTKFQDDETDLVRYEPGRYYVPWRGGWANRDPIGEAGGANLYGFVGNDPTDQFDILGQYPSVYRYSLADMQAMLRQSKEDFRRKLKTLCPISSSVGWTTVHGQKQCCSPDACRLQADVLTLEFALKLEVNFTTEYRQFGHVLAFTPLWIPGETINDRADKAPNHGMTADDYNRGFGLKCKGMQSLIEVTFVEVMSPLRRAGRQCFKGAKVGNGPDTTQSSHHWFAIYGPFNDDDHDVDVHVDPWFSAGGIVSPDRRFFGEAQYFNRVLW
jgi:RHS repeat-associated protein